MFLMLTPYRTRTTPFSPTLTRRLFPRNVPSVEILYAETIS